MFLPITRMPPTILKRTCKMLSDGVVVVTGGTSGIGRAAAAGLVLAGFKVAICGRRADKLEEARADSGAAYAGVCDVSDPVQVESFFRDVRAALGRIDVVFNNAGVFSAAATF